MKTPEEYYKIGEGKMNELRKGNSYFTSDAVQMGLIEAMKDFLNEIKDWSPSTDFQFNSDGHLLVEDRKY